MLKIYIAGKFARQEEFKTVRTSLQEYGIEVTSRWLEEKTTDAKTVTPGDFTAELNEHVSYVDLTDVRRANLVLSFTEPNGSSNKGGGRHFEAGYAYALGKELHFIGEKEIVFHYMGDVFFHKDLEAFLRELGYIE